MSAYDRMSHEARDLSLYAENDGVLDERVARPIEKNLARRMVARTYTHAAAVKAWRYLADAAAQKYTREMGGSGHGSFGAFAVAHRNEVAALWAKSFEHEVKSGEKDVRRLSGLSAATLTRHGKKGAPVTSVYRRPVGRLVGHRAACRCVVCARR